MCAWWYHQFNFCLRNNIYIYKKKKKNFHSKRKENSWVSSSRRFGFTNRHSRILLFTKQQNHPGSPCSTEPASVLLLLQWSRDRIYDRHRDEGSKEGGALDRIARYAFSFSFFFFFFFWYAENDKWKRKKKRKRKKGPRRGTHTHKFDECRVKLAIVVPS